MKSYKVLFLLTLFVLAGVSCKKQLEENMKKSLTPANYFDSEQDAINAVNGVYFVFNDGYLYSQELVFTLNFGNDEILTSVNTTASVDIREVYTMNPSNLDRQILTWGMLWTAVKNANFVISGAAAMDTLDGRNRGSVVRRVIGEAKFLRAFAYMNLTHLWGDLPKIEKGAATVSETVNLKKSTAAEIRSFIKTDLAWAADNLPFKKDYTVTDRGRITKGAAQALLAKMHLFDKEWQKAADLTQSIIGSVQYDLNPAMEKNFEAATENGIESIFELQYARDTRQNHHDLDYAGTYVPSQKLINAYEATDKRKGLYITNVKYRDDHPNGRYYFRKYGYDPSTPYIYYNCGINFVLLRYADVLLMNGEALNELNKPGDGVLQINKVRGRAEATPLSLTISQADLRTAIVQERMLELCGETWRRFDLVRWGTLVSTIKNFAIENPRGAQNISDKNVLYPIPADEIRLNPNLLPNNGY